MAELMLGTRFRNAWNVFTNRDPTKYNEPFKPGYSYRPDRPRFSRGNEKSLATSVYNKISLDVAAVDFRHCKLDKDGRYIGEKDSYLNDVLKIEANIDQTARAFIQDVAMSLLDEGVVACLPIETDNNVDMTNGFDICSMRTAKILEWKPTTIKVRAYNDRTGKNEELWVPKRSVAIIENPLYAVINEPNSTMQRLIRKLNLLDVIDEQSGSGKLDLIIQLPYSLKSELKKDQARLRKKELEDQLSNSKFGIAYTDATEHITQLNRPLENNLMKQIEYLTNLLFSQIGMTQSILDGTADEQTMLNYYNRTVAPIVNAIVDEFNRKFITKTARTQGQAIKAFRNPFNLVPINNIAEIADKFTRNEIMTSNEFRQIIGLKPVDDPKADMLINSNLNHTEDELNINDTNESKNNNDKEE